MDVSPSVAEPVGVDALERQGAVEPGVRTGADGETVVAYELGWRLEARSDLTFDVATYYNVYDRLTQYDLNHSLQPMLAESWDISSDFKSKSELMFGSSWSVSGRNRPA